MGRMPLYLLHDNKNILFTELVKKQAKQCYNIFYGDSLNLYLVAQYNSKIATRCPCNESFVIIITWFYCEFIILIHNSHSRSWLNRGLPFTAVITQQNTKQCKLCSIPCAVNHTGHLSQRNLPMEDETLTSRRKQCKSYKI